MHPIVLSACLCSLLGNLKNSPQVTVVYSRNDLGINAQNSVRLWQGFQQPYMNNFAYIAGTYILEFYNLEELEITMDKFLRAQVLRTKQRHVFVGRVQKDPGDVVEIIWKFRVTNFILLMENGNYFSAFTWSPYEGGCLNFTRVKEISECGFNEAEQVRTLNQCPLIVRTSVWPPFIIDPYRDYNFEAGIEAKMMNAIAQKLQFQLIFTLSDASDQWTEINFLEKDSTNNFKALHLDTIDILVSSMIATVKRNKYFQVSRWYFQDSDGFCVPMAGKKPQYEKWLQLSKIYLYLSVGLIVFVVVAHFVGTYKSFIDNLQNHFSVMCSVAVKFIPNPLPSRMILFLWLFYTLHMNLLLQSKLISVMHVPIYEKQITNQDELLASEMHFLFMEHYKRYFEEGSQVYSRIETCNDISVCLNNVSEDRNSGVCIQKSFLDYRMDLYKDRNGKPKIYCFRKYENTSPLIMLMNRHFHLLDEINFYIEACTESGLVGKWARDLSKAEWHEEADAAATTLTLDNLRLIFYFYLLGISASLATFACEICEQLTKFHE